MWPLESICVGGRLPRSWVLAGLVIVAGCSSAGRTSSLARAPEVHQSPRAPASSISDPRSLSEPGLPIFHRGASPSSSCPLTPGDAPVGRTRRELAGFSLLQGDGLRRPDHEVKVAVGRPVGLPSPLAPLSEKRGGAAGSAICQVGAVAPAVAQRESNLTADTAGGKEIANSLKGNKGIRLVESAAEPGLVPALEWTATEIESSVPSADAVPVPQSPATGPIPKIADLSEYPLDMSTALALVSGDNPQVGFARWRIEEAYAQLDQAQVLWLPSIQIGANYYRHDGNLQDSAGRIIDANRNSFQGGFGTSAIGAGMTQYPGLIARFHLVDAIFQPKIAQRSAWARGHAANAVLNDQLLEASLAYLELLRSHQSQAIAEETLENTTQLAQLTAEFARTGAGLQADADRMQTELALRKNELVRAEERAMVASARLAQVISLDPAYQIIPVETNVVPIQLIDASSPRQQLLAAGLSHRPELQESQCLVAEACERLKREQFAPLVPSVLLGFSYSGFGGGVGSGVANVGGKTEFNAVAFWEVRNLGFGEAAARDAADARIEQAKFQQVRVMDQIAREIAEAQSQVQLREQQIEIAQNAITAARESFLRNMERIRQGQGLPIEVLQSVQALDASRREYLTATVDYNAAQFRLQRALGWPVQ